MKDLSTRMKEKEVIELRRRYVFDLASKGQNNASIARTLKVSEPTISRDMDYLESQSKQNIQKYIDKILPLEYEKTLNGLSLILSETWVAADKAQDAREKVLALSLAKDIYDMRINLLTNASTLDAAMKFISDYKNNNNQQIPTINNNIIEVETTTVADTSTTNQVF